MRVLSADDESGAYTAFCSFPAGWSSELGAFERPVEIFTVRGELELDGQPLGEGCYGYVPSGSSQGSLGARSAGHALVMLDEESPRRQDAPSEVLDTAAMPWESPGSAGDDVPPGILIKLLRVDTRPETGRG